MLSGLWSRDEESRMPRNVNARVRQACEFLTWSSDAGRREPFVHWAAAGFIFHLNKVSLKPAAAQSLQACASAPVSVIGFTFPLVKMIVAARSPAIGLPSRTWLRLMFNPVEFPGMTENSSQPYPVQTSRGQQQAMQECCSSLVGDEGRWRCFFRREEGGWR